MCPTPLEMRKVKENIEMGDKNNNAKGVSPQLVQKGLPLLLGGVLTRKASAAGGDAYSSVSL